MNPQPLDLNSRLASHLADIPRSGIRDFFEVVETMTDVISLGIGEPDFVTPWHIREATIYALEHGRTNYTSNLGTPRLRELISSHVAERDGVFYSPKDEVLVTVGVSEALDLALRALINPGDEVIYHEPCYVSYSPSIVMAHGVPVGVPTYAEDGFGVRAEMIRERITPKTKAVILSFPTNPTGGVLESPELERVAEVAIEHDLLVITDEIYSELTYDGGRHQSIAAVPGMRERTIFLHGFSKAYAMTGYRLGYACAPAVLTEAMMKIHQYSMLCASILAQEAACEALENGQRAVEEMRDAYEGRRNVIVDSLNEIGLACLKPKGSFYVFPDIRGTGLSSKEFALRLLKEKSVAVVPGTAFGPSGEGFVRACYATRLDQIKEACRRIGDFCAEVGMKNPSVVETSQIA